MVFWKLKGVWEELRRSSWSGDAERCVVASFHECCWSLKLRGYGQRLKRRKDEREWWIYLYVLAVPLADNDFDAGRVWTVSEKLMAWFLNFLVDCSIFSRGKLLGVTGDADWSGEVDCRGFGSNSSNKLPPRSSRAKPRWNTRTFSMVFTVFSSQNWKELTNSMYLKVTLDFKRCFPAQNTFYLDFFEREKNVRVYSTVAVPKPNLRKFHPIFVVFHEKSDGEMENSSNFSYKKLFLTIFLSRLFVFEALVRELRHACLIIVHSLRSP